MIQTDWLIILTGTIGLLHLLFAKYLHSQYNGVGVSELKWYSIIWGIHHVTLGLMVWLLTKNGLGVQNKMSGDLPITTGIVIIFIGALSTVLSTVSIIAWLVFIMEYSRGVENKIKYSVLSVVIFSGVVGILAIILELTIQTGVLSPDSVTNGEYAVSVITGQLLQIEIVGMTIPILVGVLWFYSTVEKIDGLGIETVMAVSMSLLLPWVTLVIYKFGIVNSLPNLITMLFASTLIGLGALWVVVSIDKLFDVLPGSNTVREEIALAEQESAVVVIDSECRISDLNDSVKELLGINAVSMVNKQVTELLPDSVHCDAIWNNETIVFEADTGKTIECKPQDPPSEYEGSGKTLIFNDITAEITQKQRVTVLNRVLRHNLRNELSAIDGYVQLIETKCENDISEIKTEIDRVINDLDSTGKKAQRVEKILSITPYRTEATRLTEIITDTKKNLRNNSEVITTDIPTDKTTTINPVILEMIFSEATRNAIQHGNATEVTITLSNNKVQIRDNGSGIPEQEIQAVTSTIEGTLNHGSGLGLWLINWGVDVFGSTVNIYNEDGAVIEFELPNN